MHKKSQVKKPSEAPWAAIGVGLEACLPSEYSLSAPHPSLSGLKLLSEHLDPKLLSRLTQLQELDLSNNQLEVLPANLGLSHLRILRCANNQLGDVTALCQFPQLEELSLEGNPLLTVSGFAQRLQHSVGLWLSSPRAILPSFPRSATT